MDFKLHLPRGCSTAWWSGSQFPSQQLSSILATPLPSWVALGKSRDLLSLSYLVCAMGWLCTCRVGPLGLKEVALVMCLGSVWLTSGLGRY